jgi:hypothetical protein
MAVMSTDSSKVNHFNNEITISALQCWYISTRNYVYENGFNNLSFEILLQVLKEEACALSYRLFNFLCLLK